MDKFYENNIINKIPLKNELFKNKNILIYHNSKIDL